MSEAGKYQFGFAWNSPYGHAVRLIERIGLEPGLILDLGCGRGAIAEPLAEQGFKYVGCDIDPDALEDLRERGFDGRQLDLSHFETVGQGLVELAAGRRVHAVLMLDVLEHIPNSRGFLDVFSQALGQIGRPILITSVPNIAHFDVGSKLAFGHFDYTPTGLLDETHVAFFTKDRLQAELAAFGFIQLDSEDFHLYESDQHFPPEHPVLAHGAPLSNFLRELRSNIDSTSTVSQFVTAFVLSNVHPRAEAPEAPGKFLSVIMRTQGNRPDNLREALTCLAAQTFDDFEVKLLVHTDRGTVVDETKEILGEFDPKFATKVEVIRVTGGQRARPLNCGLEAARSQYVAFLDDDDLVTGDWIETFHSGAAEVPGQVVRSITVDQQVERTPSLSALASYRIHTGLHPKHSTTFDLATHFYANQTPICSFAVPKAALKALNMTFDELLPVTEDWELLLRISQVAGVHDTNLVTSVYRRWTEGEGSEGTVRAAVWDGVRLAILDRFDQSPLLFPKGSASTMAEHVGRALKADHWKRESEGLANEICRLRAEFENLTRHLEGAKEDARQARHIVQTYEKSRIWRATYPLRWAIRLTKKLTRS